MQVLAGGSASYFLVAPAVSVSRLSSGLLSSTGIGVGGSAALAVPGAGLIIGALAAQVATIAATAGAWLGYGGSNLDKVAYESYLYGLLGPVVVAIPRVLIFSRPVSAPGIPVLSQFIAALAAWSVYLEVGVIAPLFVGVAGPLLLVATSFLVPALALAYYLSH